MCGYHYYCLVSITAVWFLQTIFCSSASRLPHFRLGPEYDLNWKKFLPEKKKKRKRTKILYKKKRSFQCFEILNTITAIRATNGTQDWDLKSWISLHSFKTILIRTTTCGEFATTTKAFGSLHGTHFARNRKKQQLMIKELQFAFPYYL